MTEKQKFEANEVRESLFNAASRSCVVCGGSLNESMTPQLAHRVPRRESMLMKWGSGVINSPLNMVPVDSLKCNALVSLGTVGSEGKALLERIVRIQTGRESMPDLEDYYRAVGQEVRSKRE